MNRQRPTVTIVNTPTLFSLSLIMAILGWISTLAALWCGALGIGEWPGLLSTAILSFILALLATSFHHKNQKDARQSQQEHGERIAMDLEEILDDIDIDPY